MRLLSLILLLLFCPLSAGESPYAGAYISRQQNASQKPGMIEETVHSFVDKTTTDTTQMIRDQVPQYITEMNPLKNAGSLSKNAVSYALMTAGIGASTSIIDDYRETGEIHPDKALDFLTDGDFLKSSFGIFAGSTLLTMAGGLLPPGVGAIVKTIPGFLGAALGLEWSHGTLGEVNWGKTLFASAVSSAAWVALGAGGIVAIAGGIAASLLAESVYDQFFPSEPKTEKEETSSFESPHYEDFNPFPKDSIFYTDEPVYLRENELPSDPSRKDLLEKLQNAASQNDQEAGRKILEELSPSH